MTESDKYVFSSLVFYNYIIICKELFCHPYNLTCNIKSVFDTEKSVFVLSVVSIPVNGGLICIFAKYLGLLPGTGDTVIR